jgi:hypothetical protein
MTSQKLSSGKPGRKTFGLDILPQPTETTCGPTCLHAVYHYYRQPISLKRVIKEIPTLEGGGTLAVNLACHALQQGYQATIFSYNLTIFDPTWFHLSSEALYDKLKKQLKYKKQTKLRIATRAYLEFLERGGQVRFQDLTSTLIRKYLNRSIPIITGLSATYLYQSAREYGIDCDYDDLRGDPSGHFVVLYGYDRDDYTVKIADPLMPNPNAPTHKYEVKMPRLICSILLCVLTYDAKLLIIEPSSKKKNPNL